MTKDVSLSWTTRIHTLGSTGWKWQTSEWMFSRVERMLVPSSCWRGLGSFGCVSVPLHFPSPVLPERPTSAQRRCDPGKGIIWLPGAPSLSPTRLAHSSFLSVCLSLSHLVSLGDITALTGDGCTAWNQQACKEVHESKAGGSEKGKTCGSFLPLPLSSAGLKVHDHQQWDEILHAGFLAVLKAAVVFICPVGYL